jgi:uncharacterized membrane protein (DUF4010 family)
VLVPRVLVLSAALNTAVALALAPMLVPAFLAGVALITIGRLRDPAVIDTRAINGENPLRLGAAIRMAIAFQIAMGLITLMHGVWGATGIYASAVALGLTDVDSLTAAMSRPEAALAVQTAARAIAIGILANTCLKAAIVVVLGRSSYRKRAIVGFAGLAAGSAIGLLLA